MNAEVGRIIEYPVQAAPTPMAMLSQAVSRGMDVATIAGLMDLQARWEKAEADKAYNVAFAAFKAEAVQILRNKTVTDGPLKGKSYAELFVVVDAVIPALSLHGLSHSWKVTKDEKDWIEVTCILKHVQGGFDSVSFGGPPDTGGAKNAIQARASSKSYLERYTLLAVCGLSTKDVDKNGAGSKKELEPDAEGKKVLEACASVSSLHAAWAALTKEQRATLSVVKEECKQRIQEADRESAK